MGLVRLKQRRLGIFCTYAEGRISFKNQIEVVEKFFSEVNKDRNT
jgi:hypothetical protein